MAQKSKSYLQIIREKTKKTREVVAEEACIDPSTLVRAEKNPANTNPDVINAIVTSLGDDYAAYLYLSQNPVAMRFIPNGVERMSILQAVVHMRSAIKDLMLNMDCLLDAAVDNEISEEEIELWMESKGMIKNIVRAYIALECADGTEQ